jgi:hypothetical protein
MCTRKVFTSGGNLHLGGLRAIHNMETQGNPLGLQLLVDCRGGEVPPIRVPDGCELITIIVNRLSHGIYNKRGEATGLKNLRSHAEEFRPVFQALAQGKKVILTHQT